MENVIAMKGIAVALAEDKKAYVCFDTDLCRFSMGWTGDFLEFGNTLTQIQWPPPPQVKGAPVFRTKIGPGVAKNEVLADPRRNLQGSLPKDWAHYRGLYVNGNNVIFSYSIGAKSIEVLEMPGFESDKGLPIFTRTIQILSPSSALTFVIADLEGGVALTNSAIAILQSADGNKTVAAALRAAPPEARLEILEGQIRLHVPALKKSTAFQVAISGGAGGNATAWAEALPRKIELRDLESLRRGGPPHWTEPITTRGVVGTNDGPYAVDLITEPYPNPYNVKTFFGGFDFLPDGRAALCTFHGDVWIASGLDDKLERITWKRFATGLFQPLGLKVWQGKIYVLGRDQITRLEDLNHDGEADFYENFNNDCVVTANYHEFALDLHADSHGNFFYCKGAPWEPNVNSPHQGTLIKISPDGSKSEIYATGFRAPNGMTIGPRDEILVGDNQGHWMPSSKLNLIRPGGFYGMMPAAQRPLTFSRDGTNFVANPSDSAVRTALHMQPFGGQAPIPTSYDEPICWVPYSLDNSSGGQTFVTSDKWGPFKGHALFQSYGKCTLFNVMIEDVDGVTQAAMVQFPLKFDTGLMRARFNDRDGQLYVAGLRGWQTSATRDGGFYRVRYTGKPVPMVLESHSYKNGIQLAFASPLDPASVTNAENWTAQQWNIKYTGNYGSPEFSVKDPQKARHDSVEIKSVQRLDAKTVFVETEDLQPVNQFLLKFNLKAADGASIKEEVFGTIHKLRPAQKLASQK
jgi:hypothetical protein